MKPPLLKKKHAYKLPTGALSGCLSAEGDSLVAGCLDGVYQLQLATGEHKKLYDHESYVSSVASLPNNQIVSAGYDGAVCWFDPQENKRTRHVRLHDFWSWDMAVSPDRKWLASVTGQYLAGGYKYEPKAESEPSVKVVAIETGEVRHSLSHVPSVQAVAFSPDGQFVAAGNLMGEVRVYDMANGKLAAQWTTPDFTSWGIIKSHCYLGGVFAIRFTPDGNEVLLAGMGPMRDPMAGNGRQLWQKWNWRKKQPAKTGETLKGESGEGLMEALAIHPCGKYFLMGGRLRGGDWNAALFELASGKRVASLKTGCRITEAMFDASGEKLVLVGAQGQPRKKNKQGVFPPFGRVDVFDIRPAKES